MFGGGWGLYQQVLAGKVTGQAIGEEEIQGKKTQGVAVTAPFGAIKLLFRSRYPHLLVAARYQSVGEHGPTLERTALERLIATCKAARFAYATDTAIATGEAV